MLRSAMFHQAINPVLNTRQSNTLGRLVMFAQVVLIEANKRPNENKNEEIYPAERLDSGAAVVLHNQGLDIRSNGLPALRDAISQCRPAHYRLQSRTDASL